MLAVSTTCIIRQKDEKEATAECQELSNLFGQWPKNFPTLAGKSKISKG